MAKETISKIGLLRKLLVIWSKGDANELKKGLGYLRVNRIMNKIVIYFLPPPFSK